jgi:hypothetical protein
MATTLAGLTDAQIERYRLAELAQLARDQGRSLRQIARLFGRSPAWAAKVTTEKVSAADFPIPPRPKR